MDMLRPLKLHIDFDGYFASVEEQSDPALHGRPVGVIPMEGAENTCVISANPKAKTFGVKTGTSVKDARRLCPEVRLVPQRPDLYLRTHKAIVEAVDRAVPVDSVYSIDEVSCTADPRDRPEELCSAIKAEVRGRVGEIITCSIGFAPSRLLAKIAADMDKPDGLTVLPHGSLPGRLLELDLKDITGIGKRMLVRMERAGIRDVAGLWDASALRLREIWGGVGGARFWEELHGGEACAPHRESPRSVEHSRVLDPESRAADKAYPIARLLTVKVARRLRRLGLAPARMSLSATLIDGPKYRGRTGMEPSNSDVALLDTLSGLWLEAERHCRRHRILKLRISVDGLAPAEDCIPSLFEDDRKRRRGRALSEAFDRLNARYGKTVVGYGPYAGKSAGYAGAKIAFTRIPDPEDFL